MPNYLEGSTGPKNLGRYRSSCRPGDSIHTFSSAAHLAAHRTNQRQPSPSHLVFRFDPDLNCRFGFGSEVLPRKANRRTTLEPPIMIIEHERCGFDRVTGEADRQSHPASDYRWSVDRRLELNPATGRVRPRQQPNDIAFPLELDDSLRPNLGRIVGRETGGHAEQWITRNEPHDQRLNEFADSSSYPLRASGHCLGKGCVISSAQCLGRVVVLQAKPGDQFDGVICRQWHSGICRRRECKRRIADHQRDQRVTRYSIGIVICLLQPPLVQILGQTIRTSPVQRPLAVGFPESMLVSSHSSIDGMLGRSDSWKCISISCATSARRSYRASPVP